MASAGHHAVRIIVLHHNNPKGQRITQKDIPGLLRRHTLIFPGLIQHIHIFIQLVRSLGVNHLHPGQIHLQPARTVHDLLLVTDHDNIGNVLLHNLCRRQQRPLICSLRQHDGLFVESGPILNCVNI